jgi:feruloyl-CoA synthase
LLAWLNLGAAREAAGDPDAPMEALVRAPAVAEVLRERLGAYNAEHPASSTRVERILLLEEPPQLDADEITDKGYVNQRAVLARRRERVQELFTGGDAVILAP